MATVLSSRTEQQPEAPELLARLLKSAVRVSHNQGVDLRSLRAAVDQAWYDELIDANASIESAVRLTGQGFGHVKTKLEYFRELRSRPEIQPSELPLRELVDHVVQSLTAGQQDDCGDPRWVTAQEILDDPGVRSHPDIWNRSTEQPKATAKAQIQNLLCTLSSNPNSVVTLKPDKARGELVYRADGTGSDFVEFADRVKALKAIESKVNDLCDVVDIVVNQGLPDLPPQGKTKGHPPVYGEGTVMLSRLYNGYASAAEAAKGLVACDALLSIAHKTCSEESFGPKRLAQVNSIYQKFSDWYPGDNARYRAHVIVVGIVRPKSGAPDTGRKETQS